MLHFFYNKIGLYVVTSQNVMLNVPIGVDRQRTTKEILQNRYKLAARIHVIIVMIIDNFKQIDKIEA